jgi:hypothetical protein
MEAAGPERAGVLAYRTYFLASGCAIVWRIAVSSLHILHLVVVHHPKLTGAEGFGDREWDLRLSLDDLGLHLLDAGLHLLLQRHRGGTPDFRLSLRHVLVRLGLRDLQLGADVLTDVDVGDVDGEDLERGTHVETAGKHGLRNAVWQLEHRLVASRRSRWW